MTKKEELLKVLKNGMIGVFNDGKLGLYINGTFIKDNGGYATKYIDENGNLTYFKNIYLKEVFTLKNYEYCADINYWLSKKNFLDYKDKVVWEYKEQISFVQFLKDNNAYEAYMHNVKIENQRWEDIVYYKTLSEIKKLKPTNWIIDAFNWNKQKENCFYWEKLHLKWSDLFKQKENCFYWEKITF